MVGRCSPSESLEGTRYSLNMATKRVELVGIELRADFLPALEKVLSEMSAPAPANTMWHRLSVVEGDGLEHHGFDASNGPHASIFEGARTASFLLSAGNPSPGVEPWQYNVELSLSYGGGDLAITGPAEQVRRFAVEFEALFRGFRVPGAVEVAPEAARPFRVFIAYGGGPAWEVVRDYLRRADIDVDAFTEKERVGEVTIDVVSQMIHSATVAVIVMTAAHQLRDESWHARQNVIHEAGFAQGVLGVRNTIILLEEGVELPSNLANVTYIGFPRGGVHTTESRVVDRVRETMADMGR